MSTRIKLKSFFLLTSLTFLLSACLTNVEEQTKDPDTTDPCASITYSANIKAIMDSNCIQCHGSGGTFPNLTTYNGVSANAAKVKSEVVSKRMPQGGALTQAEINAISCWVDAGALNN